ncbi:MAG TPA: PEGA domain-containing protein [Vicinamibacterales bacterium]|nr:PEGA domain-containing protein [Vicinamibacterales bacterium]
MRTALVAATAFVLVTAWPTHASAQRRGHARGPAVRSVVFVGGGFYPRFFYYDPLFYDPWYQWRPYGPSGPYRGYGYGRFDAFSSDVRVDVAPRDAEVFVDGYSAGIVDDFDGIFQRLRVSPGAHEITIYLAGYRTIRQHRYFRPGPNDKIRATMEPLASGETAEAPPQPSAAPTDRQGAPPRRYEPDRAPERAPETAPARFGTLSLRVLPGDADLLVDGEKWLTPAGQDRTAIKLPEGRHRIEIQKEGFARYVEEILIRRDQTLTLNVSLVRR